MPQKLKRHGTSVPPPTRAIKKAKKNIPRGLSFSWLPRFSTPRVHKFSRSIVETIELVNAAGGTVPPNWSITADGGLVRRFSWDLANLSDYTDFTNLFASYRLTHVEMTFFFANTGSDAAGGDAEAMGNRQILLYAAPNRTGRSDQVLTEQFMLDNQTTLKKLCYNDNAKPITISLPLNQLGERYAGATSDYAIAQSAFISTGELGTTHHGVDIRLQRVDNKEFSNGGTVYPSCKIVTKVHLECKQVQ